MEIGPLHWGYKSHFITFLHKISYTKRMELIFTYTVHTPDTTSHVKFKSDICLHSQIIAKKAKIVIYPLYAGAISHILSLSSTKCLV